jgi:hypothetical protein
MENWNSSQPYEKFVSLKYSNLDFDEFFDEIKSIFDSIQVAIPQQNLTYLKGLQAKFDELQELAYDLDITDKINTQSDWALGFRLGEDYRTSSAVSLCSPINFGFKTLRSTIPSMGALNFNSLLLIVTVIFFKIKKLKWKFPFISQ